MPTHFLNASPDVITLDYEHALNHAGGDPELLIQLCRSFLDQLPAALDQLRRAFSFGDLDRAARALLQLQSCILVFGSGHATCTAQCLEVAIRNRRSRPIQREWIRLEEQLQRLIPQVQRLMLEMSTPITLVQ